MEKDKREKENENEETRRGEKGLGWTVWADRGKTTRPWQKKEDMRRKEKHGREGDEGRSEEREDWERRECNSKRVRESEEGRDTCNMLCHVFATYTQDCTKPWQSQEL